METNDKKRNNLGILCPLKLIQKYKVFFLQKQFDITSKEGYQNFVMLAILQDVLAFRVIVFPGIYEFYIAHAFKGLHILYTQFLSKLKRLCQHNSTNAFDVENVMIFAASILHMRTLFQFLKHFANTCKAKTSQTKMFQLI